MKTTKQVFISLTTELVADGFLISQAIRAVAQLSPKYMEVVKGDLFSDEVAEIFDELKRRQPQAA